MAPERTAVKSESLLLRPSTDTQAPPDDPCTICRRTDPGLKYTIDGWRIVRCRACHHLYVSPRPATSEIHAIYDESYFANPAFRATDHDAYFGYMDYIRDRANIQRRLAQVLARIERHEWKGRLLDVGCGLGFFVEVAQIHSWEAMGVELNEYAVAWARQHVSDQVKHGTVETIDVPDNYFDCVTMFDVIEHLPDPREELREIWRVLRPGGLLVVVTPDAGSIVSRSLADHWLEMKRAPEHLHFFSVDGLATLLALNGFTAFERQSIGKITTLRVIIADLKFYSPKIFGAIERALDKRGLTDKIVDIDPRTKVCMYARKTGPPKPPSARPIPPTEVPRVAGRKLARTAVGSVGRSANDPMSLARRYRWERRYPEPRESSVDAFIRPKIDWLSKSVALHADTSVLDVSAANGTCTWHLGERSNRVVGVDFSYALLKRAPKGGSPRVQADAALLPFADDTFDIVLESNFLHHVPDPETVLDEMIRVSNRYIVLIEANRWHPPMAAFMALHPPDWKGLRFSPRYIRRLARRSCLSVVALGTLGMIYPNHTPGVLLRPLARFDGPYPLGAYTVALLEKHK